MPLTFVMTSDNERKQQEMHRQVIRQKQCKECDTVKPVEEFGNDRSRKDGLQFYCKECNRKWTKENSKLVSSYARQTYARHKDKILKKASAYNARPETKYRKRNNRLQKEYGITQEGYEFLLSNQNNRCAICETISEKPLVVDHNHKTGAVRKLLCNSCNVGIGLFKDSTYLLSKAAAYVK